jgi:hypothetical protein
MRKQPEIEKHAIRASLTTQAADVVAQDSGKAASRLAAS